MTYGPCEIGEDCLGRVLAHHDDYAFSFRVRFLCARHHGRWHRLHGPGRNRHLANKCWDTRANRSGWIGDPDEKLGEAAA